MKGCGMPRISRQCSICGKDLTVLVDEEGEILSDIYYSYSPDVNKEHWECLACHELHKDKDPVVDEDKLITRKIHYESSQVPVEPEFGYWFSGWTDGMGEFQIISKENKFSFIYRTSLREEDKKLLNHIIEQLETGKILEKDSAPSKLQRYILEVDSREGIAKVILVLAQFPLQSRQKTLQFEIWREAYEFDRSHADRDATYLQRMTDYKKKLDTAGKTGRSSIPKRKNKKKQITSDKMPSLFDVSKE